MDEFAIREPRPDDAEELEALITAHFSEGSSYGVDLFVADSWYHGGADSPEKLFDRHGYETIHRDPIERPAAECPKCEVECTCEAALAVRRTGVTER